ncbi:hypothetical protein CDD83_7474 [Cordyceps sp. RAO-2017]|nr:hypothetical protein CDD83_7474 [Cordyceps sp. RAO-2017]
MQSLTLCGEGIERLGSAPPGRRAGDAPANGWPMEGQWMANGWPMDAAHCPSGRHELSRGSGQSCRPHQDGHGLQPRPALRESLRVEQVGGGKSNESGAPVIPCCQIRSGRLSELGIGSGLPSDERVARGDGRRGAHGARALPLGPKERLQVVSMDVPPVYSQYDLQGSKISAAQPPSPARHAARTRHSGRDDGK